MESESETKAKDSYLASQSQMNIGLQVTERPRDVEKDPKRERLTGKVDLALRKLLAYEATSGAHGWRLRAISDAIAALR